MLLRQIPLAQCPEGIARRFCNRLAPVTQIFGESLLRRLDDQRPLVGKLLVKAAMRQATGSHKTHAYDPGLTLLPGFLGRGLQAFRPAPPRSESGPVGKEAVRSGTSGGAA